MMYAAISILMVSKTVVFAGTAPWPVSYGLPFAIAAFAIIRGIRWLWISKRPVGSAQARAGLRSATILLIGACFLVLTLDLSLYCFGDESQRNFILLQLTAEGFAIFYFVMHLRNAAGAMIVLSLLPVALVHASRADAIGVAVAITIVALAMAMLFVMHGYARDFEALVASHLSLKTLGEENARLASADMITSLPNRREFFRELATVYEQSSAAHQRFAIGIVDLDGFKLVNDTHGHKVGDYVLAKVAERLQSACASRLSFFRIGGDEFAFIARGIGEDEDLLELGARLIAAVTPQLEVGSITSSVGCSVGIAVYPDASDTLDLLYERADFALYEAKRSGRLRTVIFTRDHEEKMREQGVVEQALRIADLEIEFAAVFQPITDLRTGQAISFECLARWHSPVLGDVSPAKFIPVAEQAGLISRVTVTMLRKALRAMAGWPKDTKMSFNLSPHDIVNKATILELIAIVAHSGISPSRIGFELTETAFINSYETAREHIAVLQQNGFSVALDDFGAGYSSLSHVHALPLNKLKIDRSFVIDLETSDTSRNIVRSIARLCEDLDIECVVEGAENQQQIDLLRSLGCHMAQGYYYAKPLTPEALDRYIAAQARERENARA